MLHALHITDVSPRDGLQNHGVHVPTDVKVELVNALSAAGVREIEVSSFVSPKWVPQLADAAEVFARIKRRPGVIYSTLVPNEKGLERALEAKVGKIALFTAASETFSQRNTNASIEEKLERFRPVIETARKQKLPVRVYISCAVECPYEGPTSPAVVRRVAERLLELGTEEIDLGDTIGVAFPVDIERLYAGLDGLLSPGQTVLHLHDTFGRALACAKRAMELGVRRFDTSCAGLGGCPFAPGAAGNLATEALVALAEREGIVTGIDSAALAKAANIGVERGLWQPTRSREVEHG